MMFSDLSYKRQQKITRKKKNIMASQPQNMIR